MTAANDVGGVPDRDDPGVAYLDARSVTGARYTLLERTTRQRRIAVNGEAMEIVATTYCTAYGRLAVVANDDGSFTIVETQTRLTRTGDLEQAPRAGAFPGQ